MSYCWNLLLVILLCVKQEADLAIAVRKFVYQKDMSEYCRRRVMPSVFLGRQVVDAYSQILHFSRLELPYGCFVSISSPLKTDDEETSPIIFVDIMMIMPVQYLRTESGSNIILVIQLMSDKSLIDACRESRNQLLVYEIGETFGGYWGPLPDNVMQPVATMVDHPYTLKTTQSTTTEPTTKRTTKRRTSPTTTKKLDEDLETPRKDSQEYFTVEVPIVNVSAILVPGRIPTDTIFDPEDALDEDGDLDAVTPEAGINYQTKVLPLVQFSIVKENSERRSEDDGNFTPRYEVDFNADMFTPDSRLIFPLLDPTAKRKQLTKKYNYNVNRRTNFKKNKKLFAEKEALLNKVSTIPYYQPPSYSTRPSHIFTRHYEFMQARIQTETEGTPTSWEVIDDILKNLSKTKTDVPYGKIDKNLANLVHELSKTDHNESSAFLVPESSWYTRKPSSSRRPVTTKYRTDSITWRQPPASYRTNYLDELDDTSKVEGLSQDPNKSSNTVDAMNNNDSVINIDGRSGALLPLALDVEGVIINATVNNRTGRTQNSINNPVMLTKEVSGTTTTATTPKMLKPLTLVDHESWENMVQAASLMAVMLNQSVTQPNMDDGKQALDITHKSMNKLGRKKRYIHAIPIEHARPHHLPVKIEVPSSTVHTDKISDAQEFQRLIELQDDEIHDRVALRYLRQYVGPALFNICDFDEAAARHVYLFNSSRLVLAITNFTLERMTVVMTPARTLLTSEARCEAAHLECQVSGARVCIDSLSACDGVPNCGSYDIYDEDRLMCGGSAGLQHNVCLAAVTFLAVLLTILYTVHYWLKRCVPKVSDAFFIYTDAAENILFLDTIMRSPYDSEDGKDFYRGGALHELMECTDMGIKTNSVGTFIGRIWKKIGCKRKKRVSRDKIIEEEYQNMQLHPDAQRLYSFGEVELNKMPEFWSDAAVQTGSSLEIKYLEGIKINEPILFDSESDDIVADYEGKRKSTDKRSILDLDLSSNTPSDELSILKFFRNARSVSMQIPSSDKEPVYKLDMPAKHIPHTEEKEIQCLEYDHDDVHDKNIAPDSQISITADINDKKLEHGHITKRLRFEEETKTMQDENEDDAFEEENADRPRRSIALSSSKNVRIEDMDLYTEADEPNTSINREFKSYFWGGGKSKANKKSKKKTQVLR